MFLICSNRLAPLRQAEFRLRNDRMPATGGRGAFGTAPAERRCMDKHAPFSCMAGSMAMQENGA
jgi:hypothetical protein